MGDEQRPWRSWKDRDWVAILLVVIVLVVGLSPLWVWGVSALLGWVY